MKDPDIDREAARWFRFALEDVSAAKALADHRVSSSRHVCWYSQQAAEKALKAVLVHEGIRFPLTTDLTALRALVPDGRSVCEAHAGLARLSAYATQGCYPGEWDELTAEDAAFALELALAITGAARADLLASGLSGASDLHPPPDETT